MMNRYALLLTAALGMAAAQTAPAASPKTTAQGSSSQPTSVRSALQDSKLTAARITVNMGNYVGPLSTILSGIAKSANYEVLFNFNVDALALINGEIVTSAASAGSAPVAIANQQVGSGSPTSYASPIGKPQELAAKPVVSNFVNKPFNEVWPLLMDVYELNYEVIKLGGGNIIRVSQRPRQLSIALGYTTAAIAREKATEFFGEADYEETEITLPDGTKSKTRVFKGYKLPDTLKILADAENNRLIVGGTGEQTDQVRSFISTIDIPKSAAPAIAQGQSIYTAKSSPADISAVLQTQFPTLKVTPIGQTARVIITGAQSDVTAAVKLLEQVDQAIPAAVKPAAVPIVQRIYTVAGSQSDVVAVLAKQYPGLTVSPVGTTSKVVLSGPEDQLNAALALLAQVDRPVSVTAGPDNQTQVYSTRGKPEDVAKFLAAQYPGLKITPVGATERLVISGPQDQLGAALALLDKVDQAAPTVASTVQRVFTLVNASAEEVKATLEGALAREVTPAAQNLANVPVNATDANGNAISVTVPTTKPDPAAGAAADAARQAAAAVTASQNTGGANIIADARTNTLIVRGTQVQVNQIAELIPQLDQVVPQINVQVRIQEISETAARSLGVDWKLGLGGFNITLGGGGLAASFDPTRSLVGFNLGPTLKTLESQGMTKSVYDGSVTMQSGQRSLGGSGNTQNASSTAAATIKSGGRLEVNIPSSAGNIEKQIDYGVNLDFFNPQVAPDGSITMRVRGQVNNLQSPIPTTGIPNVLEFANSEAQSLITFKSGQTVLLSGLLSTKETSSKAGVPFLSSLPVIGAAFGKQSIERTQSQLLVVITGNIVK